MARKINLPLTEELAKTLKAGDEVLLTGTIYTSRDAGHKRMCESLAKGEPLPFDPMDATIYYVGPTPAKPGPMLFMVAATAVKLVVKSILSMLIARSEKANITRYDTINTFTARTVSCSMFLPSILTL